MSEKEYIIQKINTHVFPSPFGMMHNINEITKHIRKKIIYEGEDPLRNVLNIVKTKYGQILTIYEDTYWRCLEYITDSVCYKSVPTKEHFAKLGKTVGRFQKLLDDFPYYILDETIYHFHDTVYRYQLFTDTVKINRFKRKEYCLDEIQFIDERKDYYDIITDLLNTKAIPTRVIHGDTKPSNVLFDKKTNNALCLIDLDTVMRGSLLYDYGDALRIGASTALEDEKNLDIVSINLDYIEVFTESFLIEVKSIITELEIEHLYYGYLIMTIECAMRFLTDFLENDTYFKTCYPFHNLIRAQNQIKLAKEIEKNKDKIQEIYTNIVKRNKLILK